MCELYDYWESGVQDSKVRSTSQISLGEHWYACDPSSCSACERELI